MHEFFQIWFKYATQKLTTMAYIPQTAYRHILLTGTLEKCFSVKAALIYLTFLNSTWSSTPSKLELKAVRKVFLALISKQYLASTHLADSIFLCQRRLLQLEVPLFLPIILQYSFPQAMVRCCFNINAPLLPALPSSCLWKQQSLSYQTVEYACKVTNSGVKKQTCFWKAEYPHCTG